MIATELLARCPDALRQIAGSHQRPVILSALADTAANVLGGRAMVVIDEAGARAVAASHGMPADRLDDAPVRRRVDAAVPGKSASGAEGWICACAEADGSSRLILYLETAGSSAPAADVARLLVQQAAIALRGASLAETLRSAQHVVHYDSRTRDTRMSAGYASGAFELTVGLPAIANRGPRKRLVGRSKPIKDVFAMIRRVARQRLSVLVLGETGTGKELVARAIHAASDRSGAPFVAVNCASIPRTLAESEFLGHVRGAFTGADRSRRGVFEEADGGTLFLDEIGEMDPLLQAKLLRVLDDGIVRPLGAQAGVAVDVRVLAATNRDLAAEVKAGRFRQDLYYRLSAVEIALPPLRDRRRDIPILVERFLAQLDAEGAEGGNVVERAVTGARLRPISAEALAVLDQYDWPGNVRELENELRRARALAGESTIKPQHLSPRVRGEGPNRAARPAGDKLADAERVAITRALERVDGNKVRAAKLLGISREGLRRKMKRHGLISGERA